MMTRLLTRGAAGGLLLLALALAAGCGNKEKPTATVTGKVTYNGKPQTVGTVNFLSTTGAAAQAELDANGAFKIDTPVEATEYKVYLAPPVPKQLPPGTKAPEMPKFTVSPKLQTPETSGVKVTFKPGPNDVTIEFKD